MENARLQEQLAVINAGADSASGIPVSRARKDVGWSIYFL